MVSEQVLGEGQREMPREPLKKVNMFQDVCEASHSCLSHTAFALTISHSALATVDDEVMGRAHSLSLSLSLKQLRDLGPVIQPLKV